MRTLSLTFAACTLIASLAHAQAATTADAPPAPAAPTAEAPAADQKAVTALEPQGFTYQAEGRRDPFVSLLRRGVETRGSTGPKLAGIGGLGVSEVSLRGVLTSEGAFVGILQGVDTKNYIVRVGDRLSDGTIRSISKDAMVILQQVNDPLSLEKQREVRKLLRQTEEAK
jgi:Tfp pilus assembly protein PilP